MLSLAYWSVSAKKIKAIQYADRLQNKPLLHFNLSAIELNITD